MSKRLMTSSHWLRLGRSVRIGQAVLPLEVADALCGCERSEGPDQSLTLSRAAGSALGLWRGWRPPRAVNPGVPVDTVHAITQAVFHSAIFLLCRCFQSLCGVFLCTMLSKDPRQRHGVGGKSPDQAAQCFRLFPVWNERFYMSRKKDISLSSLPLPPPCYSCPCL